MGYRNYIYVVEKEKAETIRHKSYDELKKIINRAMMFTMGIDINMVAV